jgi:hypothetical protein
MSYPLEREVTLVSGKVVSNYSEEWRQECEARHIIRYELTSQRAEYFRSSHKKRGVKATAELAVAVIGLIPPHQKNRVRSIIISWFDYDEQVKLRELIPISSPS